jgi:hypothetical protein
MMVYQLGRNRCRAHIAGELFQISDHPDFGHA